MKKYISLMNPYSFYYLWNSNYKSYILEIIEEILGIDDNYRLINTFNNNTDNLRSYLFLESNNRLVYIDFNRNNNLENIFTIYNYLKYTTNKKVYLIIFNNRDNKNIIEDNIYYVFKNCNNSDFLKLILSNNFKEQNNNIYKEVLDYLYNQDAEFYFNYLREEKFLI